MEQFIDKYISIVNKNNNIIIKLGKTLHNVFDTKLTEDDLGRFMTNLYNKYPHIKKNKVNQHKRTYKYKNTVTELNKKIYDHYSYSVIATDVIEFKNIDIKLNIIKKEYQEECLPSIYNYNSIENLEELKSEHKQRFNENFRVEKG